MRSLPYRIKAGSLQCRHCACSPSMEKISFLALLSQTLQSYDSSEMKLMTQTTFHIQGSCQTVLLWSQPSPVSDRVSQLSVGLTFSCLTFHSEFWDDNVTLPFTHSPHKQLLFLLMDFGGNIRGLAGWVQSTDLCPLFLLDSAWTPEDLRRSLLGSFLSIPIILCWPVMLCAEWPV